MLIFFLNFFFFALAVDVWWDEMSCWSCQIFLGAVRWGCLGGCLFVFGFLHVFVKQSRSGIAARGNSGGRQCELHLLHRDPKNPREANRSSCTARERVGTEFSASCSCPSRCLFQVCFPGECRSEAACEAGKTSPMPSRI